MTAYIRFADSLSSWVGKAFAWAIMAMVLSVGYHVIARYFFNAPTAWAFDVTSMMYGILFMMGGAYTLSRDAHVRADFIYRLLKPRTQAKLEFVLYFLFFFPGVIALAVQGWKFSAQAWRLGEVSINSPARIPVYQFKTVIAVAGILLFIQGIAQVMRCIKCIRDGYWTRAGADVEETEKLLMEARTADTLHHQGEAVDIVLPAPTPAPRTNPNLKG